MSRTTKPKLGSSRSARRREELRRNLPKPTISARVLLQKPEFVNAGLILLGFILIVSVLVIWSREQIKVAPGQIMLDTRVRRLDYSVEDTEATAAARETARDASPRVYRLNEQYLDELAHALNGLPKAVAGRTSLQDLSPELAGYALTEEGLAALQPYVSEGESTELWQRWVNRLITDGLRFSPLLTSEEYQTYSQTLNRALLRPTGELEPLGDETNTIEPRDDPFGNQFGGIVEAAGFPDTVARFIQAKLASDAKPTFIYDAASTAEIAAREAEAVPPVMVVHEKGDAIYTRGEKLTGSQKEELRLEASEYRSQASAWAILGPRLGIIGLVSILVLFAGGFVLTAYPRVLRNSWRVGAICLLMGGMLAISVVIAVRLPVLLYPAAVAPTLFVAIILLLSYDQRLSLFLSTVQCAVLALALEQGPGFFVLLLAGCGTLIAQLRAVRHRNSLIRAAFVAAAVLGVGALLIGLIVSPVAEGVAVQILSNAGWAVASALTVGFLVLGILPSIERLFDITTGMTLAELRDPSQVLLRQLQQLAPGTYNHSLQVANIAEAAADAIGADSLQAYVGALYHDIGKMNKPEYFVENQGDGYNRHAKLRPAMSLLVIIGHVKDGIELAREYGLPRSLQHYIESHHGTTLVEYFYHAAKTQAETDDKASVEEVEFRYPGPKPQTREAAILMLADCVESATRTMTEPNPGRIESLVRELSRKRLLDGQLDECDLTFRQLSLIEDSMIARLCAIHHGRISYPSAKTDEAAEEGAEAAESATA